MTCALFKGYALKVEKSIILRKHYLLQHIQIFLLSPKGKYLDVFFFPLRGTGKIAYTKRTYGGTPMSAFC
jgi:hypothetical protein